MVTVRRVGLDDMDALYEICLRTGDMGADASHLYDDPRLLGDVFVGPYVTMAGGIGFAAVDEEGVAGYVLAAVDTARFEAECEAEWWPRLRRRYPDPGPDPATPDAILADMIHRPPVTPEALVAAYPAHLHIDLLPRIQGRGFGGMLIGRIMAELADRGAGGVHLGVDAGNERAVGFYSHLGFSILEEAGGIMMGKTLP